MSVANTSCKFRADLFQTRLSHVLRVTVKQSMARVRTSSPAAMQWTAITTGTLVSATAGMLARIPPFAAPSTMPTFHGMH